MRHSRFGSLSRLIGLATAALIAMATVSLVHVGGTASSEADAQAARGERTLFETFLRGRLHLMARDQLSLAQWNRSVDNIVLHVNRRYLRTEILEPLWDDFAASFNVVVAADGAVLASARRDEVTFATGGHRLDGDLARLRDRAVTRYFANRIAVDGGFRQKHVTTAQVGEVAEVGFVEIDGTPHLAAAMAVVPDDGTVKLPDGPPVVLISARPIDDALLGEFATDLGFRDLAFLAAPGASAAGWAVHAIDGRPIGAFVWTSDTPGARIWRLIVPLIAGSTVLTSLAAFFVARHIGRLSSRLEESEAHNRHVARHDALTGVANRREVEGRLDAALAGLPEHPFAWIACDLDRFKAVNDTFGHAAGDTVIRTVADRLREVVGGAGTVGRIGGDEFVVLVSAYADPARLGILAAEISAAVRAPIPLSGGAETDVGVSLGIAIVDAMGHDADEIASAADAALYRAKQRGRGCFVFAHDRAGADGGSPPAREATKETGHAA